MPDALILPRRSLLAAGVATIVFAFAAPLAAQEAAAPREIIEMSIGAADAPVTMVEYASLTCPHCANFHAEVLPQLTAEYIDTGKVRMIYREVFFDGHAVYAAMLARCAGADRYFGVLDLLYRDQAVWTKAEMGPPLLAALTPYGEKAGMDEAAVKTCLEDRDFAEALVAEFQKNVTADGIESTPTFLIDGEKVSNLPWEQLRAKLEEKLAS